MSIWKRGLNNNNMCDFLSIIGRKIGQLPEIYHDATNSHSGMIAIQGWRENEPNRGRLVWEYEAGVDCIISDCDLSDARFVRDGEDCTVALLSAFGRYASSVRAAILTGVGMDAGGAFADAGVHRDIWSAAMRYGKMPCMDGVRKFSGDIHIYSGATLNAPLLAESGDIHLCSGATLNAPLLAESGNIDLCSGATLNAPLLAESGDIHLRSGATLNAPLLKR